MEKYLGVKVIDAMPWNGISGKCVDEINGEPTMVLCGMEQDGYRVVYEDGYVSWSPKDVFEKAYKKFDYSRSIITIDVEPQTSSWDFVSSDKTEGDCC